MGAGPGRGSGGRAPQVDGGVLLNRAVRRAEYACHERKREYLTMADAEVGMPPNQAPYKCAWGPHWHRVTRRGG